MQSEGEGGCAALQRTRPWVAAGRRTVVSGCSGLSRVVFTSLTTLELMPPHRPLSDEMARSTLLLAFSSSSFGRRYGSMSPWVAVENCPASSSAVCARRSLEAATIFIAFVIFDVFVTAFSLLWMALRLTTAGHAARVGAVARGGARRGGTRGLAHWLQAATRCEAQPPCAQRQLVLRGCTVNARVSTWRVVVGAPIAMATTSAIDLLQEVELLRKSERELQMQLAQQRRKEGKLVFRLAVKERETRALQLEAASLRKANTPVRKQVTELLMDPAINAEMARLREEVHPHPRAPPEPSPHPAAAHAMRARAQLEAAQRKAKELQQELEATQFQSGSIMGKKLLQKCKELQEENEQLGKELAEGPVQKLRAEAALQKEFAQERRPASRVGPPRLRLARDTSRADCRSTL